MRKQILTISLFVFIFSTLAGAREIAAMQSSGTEPVKAEKPQDVSLELGAALHKSRSELDRIESKIASMQIKERRVLDLVQRAKNNLAAAKLAYDRKLYDACKLKLSQFKMDILRIYHEAQASGIGQGDLSKVERRAERLISKMEKLLERIKNRVDQSPDAAGAKLIEKAAGHLEKARRAFEEKAYKKAVRHAEFAQRILQNTVRKGKGKTHERNIEKNIEKARRMRQKALAGIADTCRNSVRLLEKSEIEIQKARQYLKNGDETKALRHAQIAARFASRAEELCGKGPRDKGDRLEKLSAKIRKTEGFINRIKPKTENHEAAGALIRKAEENIQKSKDLLEQGAYRRAEKQRVLARTLATKALVIVKKQNRPNRMETDNSKE